MMRAATLLVVAVALLGCGADPSATSAEAAPIVERLTNSPNPQRWNFSYESDSASPYADCLSGLDAVSGAIDLNADMLLLAPRRTAPALIVTRTSLLVDNTSQSDGWLEVDLDAAVGQPRLIGLFGEVLAGYIETGLLAPDLKTTVLAAIDVAASVDATPSPFGLTGEAIEITLDPDLYLKELDAGGVTVTDEDRSRTPTITAVVDSQGRVVGLVVDPAAESADAVDAEHRGRYVISATYDDLEAIAVPSESSRTVVGLDDVDYPRPDESCVFGS